MALQFTPDKPQALQTTFGHQPVSASKLPTFGLANSIPTLNADAFQKPQFSGLRDNVVPMFRHVGKELHVVKFGALSDPLKDGPPGLQMRVTGVTRYQKAPEKFDANGPVFGPNSPKGPINKLSDTNWQDGTPLEITLEDSRWGGKINLSVPGIGPIGRVPDEIATHIYDAVAAEPDKFHFTLSNLIAGMTKGAETIGLRINVVYDGKTSATTDDVRATFNTVLNDPKAMNKVMIYQPPVSPERVLELILAHEKAANGPEAAAQMTQVIDNIVAKLKDPTNKKILLLGHCKPDGDTLGCITGLKNAIQLMDPTREVEIAVDDKIPGLFRNKVPGMNEIKHPFNPEKIAQVGQLIQTLQGKLDNPATTGENRGVLEKQIEALRLEHAALQDKANLLDPKAKYDLVVTMDIPTPTRFTDKFKPYFDSAKDTIYIDHHPHRFNEWQDAAASTGLDMQKVHDKKLAWVADKVGACAQMMTIIGNRLVPQLTQVANGTPVAQVFTTADQQQKVARYVANLVTGMSTDTGSFTRCCNLSPEDMSKPVQDRPNFYPEGTAKWLFQVTKDLPKDTRVDKKWLRENVTYDLPDNLLNADDQFTARDLMLKHAITGRVTNPALSFGVIQVDYDQMKEVWDSAREIDPEVNLLDVQNGFKYSEAMGALRADPAMHRGGGAKPQAGGPSLTEQARESYAGSYDKDRVAILICQDKKEGELDEKFQIATMNGLRLSLRSQNGSEHAELLANLFGGGGHGAAAGARVDLPGVTLTTPLGVKINGQIERNNAAIIKALKFNMELMRDNKISDAEKKTRKIPIEMVLDPQGKNCAETLESIVGEIRKTQPKTGDADGSGGRSGGPQSGGRSGGSRGGGRSGGTSRGGTSGDQAPKPGGSKRRGRDAWG